MIMSGEVLGPAQVAYLKAMEAFDRAFPGFEAEIQVGFGVLWVFGCVYRVGVCTYVVMRVCCGPCGQEAACTLHNFYIYPSRIDPTETHE